MNFTYDLELYRADQDSYWNVLHFPDDGSPYQGVYVEGELFPSTGDFTLEVLCDVDEDSSYEQILVSSEDGSNGDDIHLWASEYYSNGGRPVQFEYGYNEFLNGSDIRGKNKVRISLTRKGTTYRLYEDGQEVDSGEGTQTLPTQSSGRLGQIDDSYYDDETLHGGLYEVRIWDSALSQQKIDELKHKRMTGTEPGLKHLWKFDEGSGTTIADSVGSLDGTANIDDWYQVPELFGDPVEAPTGLQSTSYRFERLEPDTDYIWRIRHRLGSDIYPYSEFQSLTTKPPIEQTRAQVVPTPITGFDFGYLFVQPELTASESTAVVTQIDYRAVPVLEPTAFSQTHRVKTSEIAQLVGLETIRLSRTYNLIAVEVTNPPVFQTNSLTQYHDLFTYNYEVVNTFSQALLRETHYSSALSLLFTALVTRAAFVQQHNFTAFDVTNLPVSETTAFYEKYNLNTLETTVTPINKQASLKEANKLFTSNVTLTLISKQLLLTQNYALKTFELITIPSVTQAKFVEAHNLLANQVSVLPTLKSTVLNVFGNLFALDLAVPTNLQQIQLNQEHRVYTRTTFSNVLLSKATVVQATPQRLINVTVVHTVPEPALEVITQDSVLEIYTQNATTEVITQNPVIEVVT